MTFFFSNRSTLEPELKIKSNGLKQIVAERFVRLFCSLESEPPLSDGALQRHWTAGNQICRPPAASPAAATQSPRDRRISLASAPPLNLSHLGFSACVPAPFESGPPLPFLLQQVHFAPILFPASPPFGQRPDCDALVLAFKSAAAARPAGRDPATCVRVTGRNGVF